MMFFPAFRGLSQSTVSHVTLLSAGCWPKFWVSIWRYRWVLSLSLQWNTGHDLQYARWGSCWSHRYTRPIDVGSQEPFDCDKRLRDMLYLHVVIISSSFLEFPRPRIRYFLHAAAHQSCVWLGDSYIVSIRRCKRLLSCWSFWNWDPSFVKQCHWIHRFSMVKTPWQVQTFQVSTTRDDSRRMRRRDN